MTSRPEGDSADPQQEGPNPFEFEDMSVVVSVPERIEVRMVDASTLGDYEVWGSLASVLLSFCSAFVVAYCQDTSKTVLLIVAVMFGGLLIFAGVMAVRKRQQIYRGSKSMVFKRDRGHHQQQ